ncbi:hypothetical protein EDD18DRAFT_331113 [Armillaria luteobubalina]|uniref:Uncharacterized protein n=1 Tax=Armillaria luteobubalina TaxID=153913 RepID=A0AA39QLQ6_9AGAR|nr:hypothetical protein EDD18DRAFT_331113 [Armillaria luteobubalina]
MTARRQKTQLARPNKSLIRYRVHKGLYFDFLGPIPKEYLNLPSLASDSAYIRTIIVIYSSLGSHRQSQGVPGTLLHAWMCTFSTLHQSTSSYGMLSMDPICPKVFGSSAQMLDRLRRVPFGSMLGCDDSPNIQRTNGVYPSAYVALSSLDGLLRQPADPKPSSGGYGRGSGGVVFHLPSRCCRLWRDFPKGFLTLYLLRMVSIRLRLG